MNADTARDGHERLDMTVTAQDRVVGDDDPVVDHAIVGDMHVDHQQVVGADPGDALLFLAAAVDGHAFAKDVVVADLDAGRAASERDVLWLAADDREGMDDIVFAERGDALDAGMGDQAGAAADLDIRPDDAVGPDFDVVGDLRAGIDARRVSNQSGHAESSSRPRKKARNDRSSSRSFSSSPGNGRCRGVDRDRAVQRHGRRLPCTNRSWASAATASPTLATP